MRGIRREVKAPRKEIPSPERPCHMRKTYRIAVIPGDGTGPEVVAEGLKVLKAASEKFHFQYEYHHNY